MDDRSTRARLSSAAVLGAGLLAVAGANLFPLVGVAVWGWDLSSLLALYWVEAFVTVLVAVAKALLAERGSPALASGLEPLHELREKRGGWRIRPGWPPVYPRNVPAAASILGFWVVFVLPMSLLFWPSSPESVLSLGVVAGVLGLLVTRASEFVSEYVRPERYAEVSAREIVRTPAQLFVVVLSVGLLATGDGGPEASLLLLVAVVLAKTLVSTYGYYVEHVGTPLVGLTDRLLDGAELSDPPPEIELPAADVEGRVRVEPTPVLLTSLPYIAFGFASRFGVAALCLFALALLSGAPTWAALASCVVVGIAAVRVLSYYLRYGTIEYQRRGDLLVAYDTLLDAPQWKTSVEGASFSVRNAVADRLLGTDTLTADAADGVDGRVRIGPVADVERAVETLGLPVSETDRPERDPAVIAVVGLLVAVLLVVPVGLALDPRVSDAMALGLGAVFAPFVLFHLGLLTWAALARV